MPDSRVRTRFAPSPTGALHLGGARTALYNWLFARHCGGQFLLRIEDTDEQRSTVENRQQIMSAMEWLGIDWDEEVVYQSERAARHAEIIEQLLEQGDAYYCDCSPERLEQLRSEQLANKLKPRYDRHCRERNNPPSPTSVVRFKTPIDGVIQVEDSLKGIVEFDNTELDDLVIARPGGKATYHLAVVVDDMDAGITHIIRGDDHFNNTPRQLHILSALNAPIPKYTHLPMILDEQGRKLSKRKDAADVMHYREQGYLPTALLNTLARLGWAHGDEELFSLEELVEKFDLNGLNPSSSRIDTKKMQWTNQQQISRVSTEELRTEFAWHCDQQGANVDNLAAEQHTALLEVQRARCRNMADMARQSLWLLEDTPAMDEKAKRKFLTPEALQILKAFREELQGADWHQEAIKACLQAFCENQALKPGAVAQPLRVATTGGSVSPAIEDTLVLLGRDKTMQRLDQVISEAAIDG